MNFTQSQFRRMILWIVCMVFLPAIVFGQNVEHHSGPLTVGDYSGTVELNYLITETDSLLHGPFEFKSTDLSEFLTNGNNFFYIRGNFRQNIPEGLWEFHLGEYQAGQETSLVNNHYQIDLTGMRNTASGNLTDGKPDGEWVFKVEKLKNSEVVELPFHSTFQFDKGIPQLSFRIKTDEMTLLGRFLRDGLAHDQWELFGVSGVLEKWQFVNGRLEEIDLTDEEDPYIFKRTQSGSEEMVTLPLDRRYMRLIALKQRLIRPADSTVTSNMFSLLNENAQQYLLVEDILKELGYPSFNPELKVRAAYYPLTSVEKVQLDSIRNLVRSARTTYSELHEDTQLQLIRLTNEEVSFHYSVMEEINARYLEPAGELLHYQDEEVLEYVSRPDLISSLGLTENSPRILLSDSMGSRTFSVPMDPLPANEQTSLSAAFKSALFANRGLDSIRQILGKRLSQRKREQKLASLEELLILTKNQLSEHADTLLSRYSGEVAEAIRHIETSAGRKLKEYSSHQGGEQAITEAQQLITCFEEMDELILILARQPDHWNQIQDAYMNQVWNPFTATIMDEQVKRRILTAYEEVLIPYLFQRIENGPNCSETNELIYLFEAINKRMYEMVPEDTKRIERKLKREDDPEVVLELFDITI